MQIPKNVFQNIPELFPALGLGVMAGVLQVICVVDDEMYPRMKPNASGEPSTFAFHYGNLSEEGIFPNDSHCFNYFIGLSFLAAAFSFLPIQVCIYLQTSAFFSRFRNPVDKARVVPGLSKLRKYFVFFMTMFIFLNY